MVAFIAYYQFPVSKSDGGRLIGGILSILLRFFCCVWVSRLAKDQGRKATMFVILALFIPAITLIIMGIIDNKESADRIKA